MSDPLTRFHTKESKAGVSVAGAGGGTLLVLIANMLPESSKWRPLLLWAAPSAAATVGGLLLFGQVRLNEYIRERQFIAYIDDARKKCECALKNPNISEASRKELQGDLEEAEMELARLSMEKIRAFRVTNLRFLSTGSKSYKSTGPKSPKPTGS